MKNKLTGREISEETKDVLERLHNNENVSLEEVQELPELKEAYSCINNSIPTFRLKDREGVQENVLEKLEKMGSAVIDGEGNYQYNGVVGRNSRVDIVIGLPASGKSSTLVDPISQKYKSRIIDSDEAKKLLPEFNSGWGAGVVHEESQEIIIKLMEKSILKSENIVYPIVGSNYESLKNKIAAFKGEGYSVNLHYNEVARNKALGRMLVRFFETGRFLDPVLSYKYMDKVEQVYQTIKQEGDLVNEYSKWNNDVKKGEPAKFIEGTSPFIDGNLRDDRGGRRQDDRNASEFGKEKGRKEILKNSIKERLKTNKEKIRWIEKRNSSQKKNNLDR